MLIRLRRARNSTDNPLTCCGIFQNAVDGLVMCNCLMTASCSALKFGASFMFNGCNQGQAETKVNIATERRKRAATTSGGAGASDSASSSILSDSEGAEQEKSNHHYNFNLAVATSPDSLTIFPVAEASTSQARTGSNGALSTTTSSSAIPSSALIGIVVSLVEAVAITVGMALASISRQNAGTLSVLRTEQPNLSFIVVAVGIGRREYQSPILVDPTSLQQILRERRQRLERSSRRGDGRAASPAVQSPPLSHQNPPRQAVARRTPPFRMQPPSE
ncbi:hypothetical protein DFJ73DRAFT_784994 [Zopfochytrium polystomum]|nr:hypothetical protein DFJ73DRAFT_784994 [Zopfochytrium polystomum]